MGITIFPTPASDTVIMPDVALNPLPGSPVVTNVTSTKANGTYGIGVVISIQVVFDQRVVPTGTPTLALNSGGSASYASGTGTFTLNFTYTVAGGQNSADLDYTATNSLAGTIKSEYVVAADLTLFTPGDPGSLGANKAIIIST